MNFPHDIHFYRITNSTLCEMGVFNIYCSYDKWPSIKTVFRTVADFYDLHVSFDAFQIEKDTVMHCDNMH